MSQPAETPTDQPTDQRTDRPVRRPALLDPLDPARWPDEVPVLIVGGGPVGLVSAILLAQSGVEVLLVERRPFEARFPRAHLLNVRTMEIFDQIGVADDIRALAPRDDEWRKVVWYTSVDGPSPLHGLKLGQVPAWGGGADAARYAQASPQRFANLPQIRLDPLLWAHAEAACPGRIRAGQELTGIRQTEGGVVATVLDRASGAVREVRARYLIGADGGRTTADLLGVEREGPKRIQDVVSLYVSTDLSMWREESALLCHVIQPSGGGRAVGTLQALGPYEYGRLSPEWLVATRRPGDEPTDDPATLLARARDLLGLPHDHPMTLHAVSHWQYEGVVAERFRVGPAFLAGDAAHRHPPTGGLGLNGGVQDAHNLAWKLAAVLSGAAPDSLLDSYERERRPIAAANTAHSLENAGRHAPIGGALGLEPGLSEEEGWARIAAVTADTPEGEARRAAVAAAVADNAMDYGQLNVEAGFAYPVGALVPDVPDVSGDSGGFEDEAPHDPVHYRATTRPGHHLPHAWLDHTSHHGTGRRSSTLDLVEPAGFTLLVGPAEAQAWQTAAESASRPGLPVTTRVVADVDAEWARVREVGPDGAVLVRPDRKVAWRTAGLPADPGVALLAALDTILRGGDPAADDPAQPHLDRIRRAAALLAR